MIGKRIREARKLRKFTQKELGAKLNLAESTIAGYELEHRVPSAKMLQKIAEVLEVSTDFLLGIDTDGPNQLSLIDFVNPDEFEKLTPKGEVISEKNYIDLMKILELPHVKLNGHILDDYDKKRIIDVLTGLFWGKF